MAAEFSPLDETAFLRLVLQSERELLRYVMAVIPDREDARDVVQETLVALWKKRERYDPERPFAPWACRFAANEIRAHCRKSAKWRWIASEPLIDVLFARREELATELDERHEQLKLCLEKLPERQKSVIEQYYFEELEVADVAKHLSTSVDAVYKILQRSRQFLFDCVSRGLNAERGAHESA